MPPHRTAYVFLATNYTNLIAKYGSSHGPPSQHRLPGSSWWRTWTTGNPGIGFSRRTQPPCGSTSQMPPAPALGHHHPR
ncbi:hypothetical protein E2C01_039224 [Portunus trituberculatus]|uniref:Uncharacterized protein n=1 Tax=Portunus trituberculatus TaxID=210409 RepID=A0A5B7FGA6_PORTR|nr:hypothetical protein [Portunus trituberculatus]